MSAVQGHVDRAALVAKIRECYHVATSHDYEVGPTYPPSDVVLVPLADTPFEATATVLSAVREGRDDDSAPTIFWLPSVAKPLERCEADGGKVAGALHP